ncbi:MAG: hypothetical protein FWH05_07700 [Oscillospiraceae bacterium]|nr:hypothetical protein [Oscillospiraceae bacterium]
MSNLDDKKELLLLKQGLKKESDVIPTKKPPKVYDKPKGFKAKWENFWYHYWLRAVGCIFALFVLTVLSYEFLSRKTPDLSLLAISDDWALSQIFIYNPEIFTDTFLNFTPDFDQNGYTHVGLTHIDFYVGEYAPEELLIATGSKLFGALDRGQTIISIGSKSALKSLPDGIKLVNLKELYPRNNLVEEEYFFNIKGSKFEEILAENGLVNPPDGLYLTMLAIPDETSYTANARTVFDNVVKNNIIVG